MLILRPTQKLAKRLHCTLVPTEEVSTTRLGDWYCNFYQIGRAQVILSVSERSRLPVIVPAKDPKNFPTRLQTTLRGLLRAITPIDPLIDAELAEMQEISYAKSANRSITGTLNEFGRALDYYDFDPSNPAACHDLSLVLADVICTPLDNQTPIVVTQAIFSAVSPADLPSMQ